jgi:hypothetical protein
VNIRMVLRTYSYLRQLTDDETALLETLRGMNDSERELLVESLSPAKGQGKKKATKKPASTSGNSRRGLPLTEVGKPLDGGVSKMRCAYTDGDDPTACGDYADGPIHDPKGGYGGYHPFVALTTARGARNQLSRNGEGTESVRAEAGAGIQSADIGPLP